MYSLEEVEEFEKNKKKRKRGLKNVIYRIIIGGKKKKERFVAGSLLVRKRVGFFVCILLLKGKYLLLCTEKYL